MYQPKNAPDSKLTREDHKLKLQGPGWALFNEETDDDGWETGVIQALDSTDDERFPDGFGPGEDCRAMWHVAYDYARMRAMLERCLPMLEGYALEGEHSAAALADELRNLIQDVQP